MALTRVGLAITLAVNSTCTTITVTDSTGAYNVTTNPLGYGLPGGIATTDVSSLIVTVNIQGGSYFTYTFTIDTTDGSVTAATLSLSGGTATNIFASLPATVFPLSAFDLWGSYGVTLPTFGDGIIEVDYTIGGSVASGDLPAQDFNYTTSGSMLVPCSGCCCVQKMGLAIDPDCACSNEAMWNYLRASTYLEIAKFNTQIGKNAVAQSALTKAQEICDCEGCGCS